MTALQEHKALAEYAVKLADAHFDYAEVYLESSKGRFYAVEQGRLNGSSTTEKTGLRLRLLKGKRLYTYSTNKLDKRTIAGAISGYRSFDGADTVFSEESAQRATYKVPERERIDGADLLNDLLSLDKTLKEKSFIEYRSLYAGAVKSWTLFVNSEGSRVASSLPFVGIRASIIVKSRGETRQRVMQFGGTGGYEVLSQIDLESKLLSEAKALLGVIENGVRISDQEARKISKVVISPEIAGIAVHESIGHPNEADRVFLREAAQAGTSYLTRENLGLEIGSEAVTIIDDPTIKNSCGFYLYDEEGVAARPRTIVDRGTQEELLTNRAYAHVLGKKSNASARSDSYSNEPLVRMANTYLKPGTATLDELVSEAGSGAYIKSFTEWNIDDTRSFSRYQGSEAYLIKNHRLDKPVKNYRLETRTLDFWHAVRLVGRGIEFSAGTCGKGEPQQGIPVSMGGPSALLEFGG